MSHPNDCFLLCCTVRKNISNLGEHDRAVMTIITVTTTSRRRQCYHYYHNHHYHPFHSSRVQSILSLTKYNTNYLFPSICFIFITLTTLQQSITSRPHNHLTILPHNSLIMQKHQLLLSQDIQVNLIMQSHIFILSLIETCKHLIIFYKI